MKVFFDARYIRTDFHDGISRYSAELGSALAAKMPVTFLVCDKKQLKFLPSNCSFIEFHSPTSIKEPFSALLLNKYQPDIVFSPMQTIGTFGRKFKIILTLHDMIYYRHRTPPRNLSALIRFGWQLFHLAYWPQRLVLNSANMVATVSQTSQNDILQANLTKRPTVVIPNAPQNLETFTSTPTNTEAPRNIIYMGSFMPYKNVETLVKAMSLLPDHTLHLLSRITPERKRELLALAPTSSIVFHNGVSDETYAQLLANNAILASASLDEGYGIPLAEALAFGVPAVVSELPIFHEVAGQGALYFDPLIPRQFAECVKKLDSKKTRQELVRHGKKHIAQYSWGTSAEKLAQTIQSLAK